MNQRGGRECEIVRGGGAAHAARTMKAADMDSLVCQDTCRSHIILEGTMRRATSVMRSMHPLITQRTILDEKVRSERCRTRRGWIDTWLMQWPEPKSHGCGTPHWNASTKSAQASQTAVMRIPLFANQMTQPTGASIRVSKNVVAFETAAPDR